MGRYPLAKILIAFAYIGNCNINSLYILMYFSFILLRYNSGFIVVA